MATVNEILTLAYKQVGYVEKPVNDTKYGRKFGMRQAQWCGYFIDWLFVLCDMEEPTCAYTPNGAKGFKKINRLYETGKPKSGDILFFDFPNDDLERISHTGIVVQYLGRNKVLTIEGNTSAGLFATKSVRNDERNGGMVDCKIRNMSDIVCWGRPDYDNAPMPVVNEIMKDAGLYKEPVKKETKKVVKKASKKYHIVISGDTLWGIAIQNQLTVSQLKSANNIRTDVLKIGQKLFLPEPTKSGKAFSKLFGRKKK